MRTLTQRELNRTLLARQMLLRRARVSIPEAVERLVALQAQASVSPYVALWSRLDGFRNEQLTRALERGTVVKSDLAVHHAARDDQGRVPIHSRQLRRLYDSIILAHRDRARILPYAS